MMTSMISRVARDVRMLVQLAAAMVGLLADIRFLMAAAMGATEAQSDLTVARTVPQVPHVMGDYR